MKFSISLMTLLIVLTPMRAQGSESIELSEVDSKEYAEAKKCYTLANNVCGINEKIDKCLLTKRRHFSSFCVEKLTENATGLKELTDSADIQKCTVDLSKKCKLDLPEAQIRPDMNQIKAAIAKYQKCMTEKAETEPSCNMAKKNQAKRILDKSKTSTTN